MSLTNFSETAILIWLLTQSAVSRPTAPLTVALHTGDPGEDGTANEVDVFWGGTTEATDYARQTITFDDAVADSGQSLSSNAPSWTVNSSSPGLTLTHVSIWENGGDCIFTGSLYVIKALVADQVHIFNIGDIVAVLD